jgi:hypothetical protein
MNISFLRMMWMMDGLAVRSVVRRCKKCELKLPSMGIYARMTVLIRWCSCVSFMMTG